MRMWMVDPRLLCRKHLLGEHGEIHKFRHSFVKKHDMSKRVSQGQIEPSSMGDRHDELAAEMLRRGYNHQSPYEQPNLSYLTEAERHFKVDVVAALDDLHDRCAECRERFLNMTFN